MYGKKWRRQQHSGAQRHRSHSRSMNITFLDEKMRKFMVLLRCFAIQSRMPIKFIYTNPTTEIRFGCMALRYRWMLAGWMVGWMWDEMLCITRLSVLLFVLEHLMIYECFVPKKRALFHVMIESIGENRLVCARPRVCWRFHLAIGYELILIPFEREQYSLRKLFLGITAAPTAASAQLSKWIAGKNKS